MTIQWGQVASIIMVTAIVLNGVVWAWSEIKRQKEVAKLEGQQDQRHAQNTETLAEIKDAMVTFALQADVADLEQKVRTHSGIIRQHGDLQLQHTEKIGTLRRDVDTLMESNG